MMTYKEFNDEVIVKLNEEKAEATRKYEDDLMKAKLDYENIIQGLAMAKADFNVDQKRIEKKFMEKFRAHKTAVYRDYLEKTADIRCKFKEKKMAIEAKRQLHFCERRAEIEAELKKEEGGEL